MNAKKGLAELKKFVNNYDPREVVTGSYNTADGISAYGLSDGDESPVIVNLRSGTREVFKLWPGE